VQDDNIDLTAALAIDRDPPSSCDVETFNIYHIQQDVKGLVCFSLFVFNCFLTKRFNKFCFSCEDTGSMMQYTVVGYLVILCVSTLFGSACLFQQKVETCGLLWVCPIHNNENLILKVLHRISYWYLWLTLVVVHHLFTQCEPFAFPQDLGTCLIYSNSS
jgi:hypothetical protein